MDGGDISSFVTNGEWDLIGNNNLLVSRKCRCAPFVTSYFGSFSFYQAFAMRNGGVSSLMSNLLLIK